MQRVVIRSTVNAKRVVFDRVPSGKKRKLSANNLETIIVSNVVNIDLKSNNSSIIQAAWGKASQFNIAEYKQML